ncbi:MAG TPA: ribonuclease P protein component [Bacteroidales bacterium]|nr:ribonuclease P protein component [Bacteroidales bacterium]
MNRSSQTFNKTERLCSTKLIADLFENGNTFYTPVFKVVWEKSPVALPSPAQVAFSVTRRGFRLAVTRNLIKRRMRESYRKNKKELYDCLISQNIQLVFIVIYRESRIADYPLIEKSMIEVISRLGNYIKEGDQKC